MNPFEYQLAVNVDNIVDEKPWLIKHLWHKNSVGILGGHPKCFKTWLALEMALSIASSKDCLNTFSVQNRGPVLIFPAEDKPHLIKQRLMCLAMSKNVDFNHLNIFIMTPDSLDLGKQEHCNRLMDTIAQTNPIMLILDPLVRIHHSDENNAQEVAKLLSFLRFIQRKFNLAVLLVHHMRKNAFPSQRGQALRGSSDLHAWSDTNILLRRKEQNVLVNVEHRYASSPDEFAITLDTDTYPKLILAQPQQKHEQDLQEAIIKELQNSPIPLNRDTLRKNLSVKNQRLCDALHTLASQNKIKKSSLGYSL